MRPALIALCLLSCVPLDRRPPFRGSAYARDHAAIMSAASERSYAEGPYRAGWSRRMIDAPPGVPLAGFGDREGAPSEGVRDPAYVRAFAVAAGKVEVVIFTADLLNLGPTISGEIRRRLTPRLPPERVFFTASHTHSGPGAYVSGLIWEMVLGPYDARAFEAVVDAHVKSAEAALDDLRPAKIGSTSFPVPGIAKNRTEKGGPVDDRLFLMTFERADGVAAFWAYGCHAVTLTDENRHVSADFPGTVAAAFEGRSLAMLGFAAGGVGSANPRLETEEHDWLVQPLVAALKRAIPIARQRAIARGTLASAQVNRPVPPLRYRVTKDLAIWSEVIGPVAGVDTVSYGAVAIQDTVLLHMPSETSGNLTKIARSRARRRGIELAVLPFNGTYIGYVTPRRIYDLPPEKGEELLHYETHVMTFLGPWGGDLMMNLGLRLAAGVHASRPKEPGFY